MIRICHRASVGMSMTLLCASVLVATPAAAQNVVATSFDQLRMIARLGDNVSVTDTTGHVTTGKVADLSSSSLALLVGSARREIPEGEVKMIRQQRHGSPATGAKWGLGIGAVFGVIAGVAFTSNCYNGCGAVIPVAAALYGGIGSGIGAGVAAMTTTERTIYSKPGTGSAKLAVSPLLTRERQGVAMSFRF